MTQNEVSIIKNAVLDATEAYVDARLANADFVKTQIGVVTGSSRNANGKWEHTVVCNRTASSSGITYTKVLSVGNIDFTDNSIVFLIAPNAQYSNQFILGKLDSTPSDIVGGSIYIGEIPNSNPIDYYFSVNKYGQVTIKHPNSSIKLQKDSRFPNKNWYHINLDENGLRLGHNNSDSNSYNFTVDMNGKVTIKSGSININNKFYADDQGNLAVGGTSSSANFYVSNDGSVTIKSGSINIKNKFYVDSNGNLFAGGTTTSNAQFYVEANDGSVHIKKGTIDIANKFHVDPTGWLAVGGNSSSAKFYVDSDGNVTAKYLTANVGGYIGGFQITEHALGTPVGTEGVGMINTRTGSSSYNLYAWHSSYNCRVYQGKITCSTGSVSGKGIYVYSGSDENGNYILYGHSSIYRSSDGYEASFSPPSDKRLKKNIKDISIDEAKNLIYNLSPKKFEYKNKTLYGDGERYGFIAQELRKNIDENSGIEFVTDKGYHGINYNDFIAPLCKVVQDQQKQIDELKVLIKDK